MSRCPRPGGLYDGDDEASRVPGKPTRTHATRSDPGEVAASTASEMRRDSLPSNARRRPSQTMHFGAQSRGLRAPCERFAPWVTPGPRITRFRLAADLGRMGLDTHRVSNKVSKITSRHLVPLDRAFPAHALVRGSAPTRKDFIPLTSHLSLADGARSWTGPGSRRLCLSTQKSTRSATGSMSTTTGYSSSSGSLSTSIALLQPLSIGIVTTR